MIICYKLISIAYLIYSVASTELYVDRPRGVPLNRKSLYNTEKKNFVCLDSSATIPFSWVNDDYCDCKDGTDEPGTAACPNGTFNCPNLGYKPTDIPSSRVNDEICDCCDGSDEWAGYVKCPNVCEEFGRKAREDAERQFAIQREGYQKLQQLIKEGKKSKEEKQHRIEELKNQKTTLEPQLDEFDMVKQVAEKKEKEAKDRHMDKWKAENDIREKERQKQKATKAFDDLDTNKDQKISLIELIARTDFDKNFDGTVTPEEAQEFLGGTEDVEREKFIEETWNNLKHLYKFPTTTEESIADQLVEPPPPPPSKSVSEKIPGEDGETEEEVKEDEVEDFEPKDHDDDKTKDIPPPSSKIDDTATDKMPEFDEETKKLIADADQARKEYDELKRKVNDIEDEIKRNDEFLKMDLGPNDEFASLVRQCFEYTELQYTYKFCMFDRTSQKSKDGGSETSLGTWGNWEGVAGEKYLKQMYKNGLTCWNGPARSTEVKLVCGSENKLVGASEPARCEYAFEFHTPAVCTEPPATGHDEL